MPRILDKTPFSEDLLPLVQDFDCGDDEASKEVSDWIKGPVLEDIGSNCQVWLYSTEQDGIVAFSSLGGRNWRYPNSKKSALALVNTIPFIGIKKQFQGEPRGDPPKYFTQIMAHLAFEAGMHADRLSVIGLVVRPDNDRAIKAYMRVGFTEFPPSLKNKETGAIDYIRLIANIESLPGQQPL